MEGMRGIHKVQAKTPEINMLASWLELDFGGMRTIALGVLANFCVKWGIKRKNVLGAIRISALGVLASFLREMGELKQKCPRRDSNAQPSAPQAGALSIKLRGRFRLGMPF